MGLLGDIFGSLLNDGSKSPSDMSDRELQRKLNSGVGKNTGESVATRANYIREGQKRGITPKQK